MTPRQKTDPSIIAGVNAECASLLMQNAPHPIGDHEGIQASPSILIIGMHRSGTSGLARALVRLGLNPPPGTLLGGDTTNPRGHYESIELIELNDALLRMWDATIFSPPLAPHSSAAEVPGGFFDNLASIVEKQTQPWVWKDPRLCLTLGFWRRIMSPAGCILIWRRPEDVADSLQRRDGLPLALGDALWYAYNQSALTYASGMPAYVLSLEDLLDSPATCIAQISDFISSVIPAFAPRQLSYASAAIEPDLLHSKQLHRREHAADSELIQCLASLKGGHMQFDPQVPSPLDTGRAALLESRRLIDLELWDLRGLVQQRRVQAIIESTLDARDVRLLDSVKRWLNRNLLTRSIGRVVRQKLGGRMTG